MATPLPVNHARFSLGEIATITAGSLTAAADPTLSVAGVATDSRADVAGRLFVALRGERFDGHDHALAAARAGARALLVERDVAVQGVPCVRVSSALDALGRLAAEHRRRWGGRVIAVAGSAGKTTSKRAIAALLSALHPGAVHEVAGNLNNLIGVPLVLLGLSQDVSLCVVEIGTNAPGEVARLASLARPEIGVLTLIAIEHSEGLGDLDGIEREEGALFDGLVADGVAVGNGDDPRVLRRLSASPARLRVRYGFAEGLEVRALAREPRKDGGQRLVVRSAHGELALELGLGGEAGAYAALAAVAVAEALGGGRLDEALVGKALAGVGEPGRLRPIELADGTLLLDDTYNANPASVLASLRAASEIAKLRGAGLFLVVGEMRELGRSSRDEHEKLAAALAESGARALVAVGGDALSYVAPARAAGLPAEFAGDADQGLELVRASLRAGDVVLIKASRGVRAERIVEGLVAGARPLGGAA